LIAKSDSGTPLYRHGRSNSEEVRKEGGWKLTIFEWNGSSRIGRFGCSLEANSLWDAKERYEKIAKHDNEQIELLLRHRLECQPERGRRRGGGLGEG
jgi:hypothetical protein